MRNLLELENLTVSFSSGTFQHQVVSGVSFELSSGETTAIVGESGGGKSTLAQAITKLLPQNTTVTGSIKFEGREITTLSHKELRNIRGKEIGMVFQDPLSSLNPVLPIGLQISETLSRHLGLKSSQLKQRTLELLTVVGIPEPALRAKHYPHQFSGGMQQRIMLAIATACSPKLLIADEPTSALDVLVQAQIMQLIDNLRKSTQMTVLLITHDLALAHSYSTQVIVLQEGKVVEQGDTRTVFSNPQHSYTRYLIESSLFDSKAEILNSQD